MTSRHPVFLCPHDSGIHSIHNPSHGGDRPSPDPAQAARRRPRAQSWFCVPQRRVGSGRCWQSRHALRKICPVVLSVLTKNAFCRSFSIGIPHTQAPSCGRPSLNPGGESCIYPPHPIHIPLFPLLSCFFFFSLLFTSSSFFYFSSFSFLYFHVTLFYFLYLIYNVYQKK